MRRKIIPAGTKSEDLLVPIFRAGQLVYKNPALPDIQDRARIQLTQFHESIKRVLNPHVYPVGLEKSLADLRTELVMKARKIP
jgi:nicotinate phosphoribosyltransferase